MKLIDVIPKFSQYEGISYAGDLNCPHCDKSGFFDFQWENREKPNLVGWCETNIGYMAIFECPVCFEKFRFHCTIGTWTADTDEFDTYLYYKARECGNWEELKSKLKNQ